MRKKIFILLVIIIIAICLIKDKDELRVRIIPNDNSKISLEIKEKVKDEVILFLSMTYDETYNVYIENIENDLIEFNKTIKKYNAQAELVMHKFINKTSEGKYIKDEKVLTFLVKIDSASGDNWWGIVYPKFLDIESSDTIVYESYIIKKIKEWFS